MQDFMQVKVQKCCENYQNVLNNLKVRYKKSRRVVTKLILIEILLTGWSLFNFLHKLLVDWVTAHMVGKLN